MSSPIVAIPVKPFSLAKQRLATALDADTRRKLSVGLAARTADIAQRAGGWPLILSADDDVTRWATEAGHDVLLDEGSSLNDAARSATGHAGRDPWIICHADLPLLNSDTVARAIDAVRNGRWLLAPSSDGGTSMVGGTGSFEFSFGVGSFHRHLARVAARDHVVITSTGTLLDLDTPSDIAAAISHRDGKWLTDFPAIASLA